MRDQNGFGGKAPIDGARHAAGFPGGLDIANLVADAECALGRGAGLADHLAKDRSLAEQGSAASEDLETGTQFFAQNGLHGCLAIGADDGEFHALGLELFDHAADAVKQMDLVDILGGTGADIGGDEGYFPGRNVQRIHDRLGRHATQFLGAGLGDRGQAVLVDDVTEHTAKPGQAVRERSVKVEDYQIKPRQPSRPACRSRRQAASPSALNDRFM